MRKKQILLILACVCWITGTPPALRAGEFTVEPFRLEMGPRQRSGVFTVTNVGSEPLNFQVRLSEWTQDSEGKDIYSETADIVFYPRIISVKGGERQIIRVGANKPIVAREKSYRLFIEEMPSQAPPGVTKGAQVTVRISFAPPIFVRPAKVLAQATIESLALDKSKIKVAVRNAGNVHVRFRSVIFKGIDRDGNEVFSKKVDGWYVLSGVSRTFDTQVPDDVCAKVSLLDVTVEADDLALHEQRDIGGDPNKCLTR